MDIERVQCNEEASCANCGQQLLGWECWRDESGAHFCDADCWANYREQAEGL